MARKSRKATIVPERQAVRRIYNAALYTRLSFEDIRKKISGSIGTQKTMLLQFLQTQQDMTLYSIYEDVNYTGTNFDRPGFIKMVGDIQSGFVDCVIVKDLSRFGRHFKKTGDFLERVFPSLGVRFISVDDNYDSLTASVDESSLILPLKNLMNEVYARDISKKIQSGIKMKQNRGEFCGSVTPYGYIKKGNSFTVDEETSPVVRRIFAWILDGDSDYAIVNKLNGLKITPPGRYRFEKGITKVKKHEETKFWHQSAVKRISENPVYTGVLAQAKQQSAFLKGGTYELKSRSEWVIVEGMHEAIIDKEIFEAVRKIRDSRRKNYKTVSPAAGNIFKGMIICADCGAHMTRRKLYRADGNNAYYFACNTYMQADKHACTKKKIMESELTETVFSLIRNQIKSAADISAIIQTIQKQFSYRQQYNTLDKRIDELQKKLRQNCRFRGSLREKYKDGMLSGQDYSSVKTEYDGERENLQSELKMLLSAKIPTDAFLPAENKWITEFGKFGTEQYLSPKMISALIERIYVSDNAKIAVLFRYRDEFEALNDCVKSVEQGAAVNE